MRSTPWLLLLSLSGLLSFVGCSPVSIPALAQDDSKIRDAEYGAKSPRSISHSNPSALSKDSGKIPYSNLLSEPHNNDALITSTDLSLKATGGAPILKAHPSLPLSGSNQRLARDRVTDNDHSNDGDSVKGQPISPSADTTPEATTTPPFECFNQNTEEKVETCEPGQLTCALSFSLSFNKKGIAIAENESRLGCSDHHAGIILNSTDASLKEKMEPQFIVYCNSSMCNQYPVNVKDIATRFKKGEFAITTTPEPATTTTTLEPPATAPTATRPSSETTTNGGEIAEGGWPWWATPLLLVALGILVLAAAFAAYLFWWKPSQEKEKNEAEGEKKEEKGKKKGEEKKQVHAENVTSNSNQGDVKKSAITSSQLDDTGDDKKTTKNGNEKEPKDETKQEEKKDNGKGKNPKMGKNPKTDTGGVKKENGNEKKDSKKKDNKKDSKKKDNKKDSKKKDIKKKDSKGGKSKSDPPPPGSQPRFFIPAKDIKFRGPLVMQPRHVGSFTHADDKEEHSEVKPFKEIVIDKDMMEAYEIGEGVEKFKTDDASDSTEEMSEYFKDYEVLNIGPVVPSKEVQKKPAGGKSPAPPI